MSADPSESAVDVDALVARLQQVVAERREAGDYPPGLERDLDDHFRRIMARPFDETDLPGLLDKVRAVGLLDRSRIDYTSGLPIGAAMHRTIGRVVARQTQGLVTQVNDLTKPLLELLDALVKTRPVHQAALADLSARVDLALDRVAAFERLPEDAGPELRALAERVERLERETRVVRGARPYSRAHVRADLLGTREEVKAAFGPLAALLQDAGQVTVLGAGDGEMLELLAAMGVDARAVEPDPDTVAALVARGLSVARGEPLAHLLAAADGTVRALFIDGLESLPPDRAIEVLRTSAVKLSPGATLVVLLAPPIPAGDQPGDWWADPERVRPLPARLVRLLLGDWGFQQVAEVPVLPGVLAITASR